MTMYFLYVELKDQNRNLRNLCSLQIASDNTELCAYIFVIQSWEKSRFGC